MTSLCLVRISCMHACMRDAPRTRECPMRPHCVHDRCVPNACTDQTSPMHPPSARLLCAQAASWMRKVEIAQLEAKRYEKLANSSA
eukprot:5596647-Pleurochrysis_carterae.AAC.2